jgi:hypothetical protein
MPMPVFVGMFMPAIAVVARVIVSFV